VSAWGFSSAVWSSQATNSSPCKADGMTQRCLHCDLCCLSECVCAGVPPVNTSRHIMLLYRHMKRCPRWWGHARTATTYASLPMARRVVERHTPWKGLKTTQASTSERFRQALHVSLSPRRFCHCLPLDVCLGFSLSICHSQPLSLPLSLHFSTGHHSSLHPDACCHLMSPAAVD